MFVLHHQVPDLEYDEEEEESETTSDDSDSDEDDVKLIKNRNQNDDGIEEVDNVDIVERTKRKKVKKKKKDTEGDLVTELIEKVAAELTPSDDDSERMSRCPGYDAAVEKAGVNRQVLHCRFGSYNAFDVLFVGLSECRGHW